MCELQEVIAVNGMLQAMVIRANLEKAGIPSVVKNSRGGYCYSILVSAAHRYDASNLLYPSTPTAEILVPVH